MIPPTSPVYPGYPGAPTTPPAVRSVASRHSATGAPQLLRHRRLQRPDQQVRPQRRAAGVFASGFQNPLSLVFDNSGNLYVGQQNTPYIAEFNSSGQDQTPTSDPSTTGETGDDWIDLASDQCTFYYTTETNVVYRYRQLRQRQQRPAIELQLGPLHREPTPSRSGSFPTVGRSWPTPTPSCGSTPTGTSTRSIPALRRTRRHSKRPTLQAASIRIQLAARGVPCPMDVGLRRLSSSAWPSTRAAPPSGPATRTRATSGRSTCHGPVHERGQHRSRLPLRPDRGQRLRGGRDPDRGLGHAHDSSRSPTASTGNFSTPTPVSATLTNSTTNAPIAGEPVTFTLNGNPNESCTADHRTQRRGHLLHHGH